MPTCQAIVFFPGCTECAEVSGTAADPAPVCVDKAEVVAGEADCVAPVIGARCWMLEGGALDNTNLVAGFQLFYLPCLFFVGDDGNGLDSVVLAVSQPVSTGYPRLTGNTLYAGNTQIRTSKQCTRIPRLIERRWIILQKPCDGLICTNGRVDVDSAGNTR